MLKAWCWRAVPEKPGALGAAAVGLPSRGPAAARSAAGDSAGIHLHSCHSAVPNGPPANRSSIFHLENLWNNFIF